MHCRASKARYRYWDKGDRIRGDSEHTHTHTYLYLYTHAHTHAHTHTCSYL